MSTQHKGELSSPQILYLVARTLICNINTLGVLHSVTCCCGQGSDWLKGWPSPKSKPSPGHNEDLEADQSQRACKEVLKWGGYTPKDRIPAKQQKCS